LIPIDISIRTAAADAHATAKFWLGVADSVIKGLAIVVGGFWTYLNYRRGRTFSKRLEPDISGHLFMQNERHFLFIQCRLKNVGLSKVQLDQKGSACMIFALTPDNLNPPEDGTPEDIFSVFKEHEWIEAGEPIAHDEIVPADFYSEDLVGIRVTMRLVSKDIDWTVSRIIDVVSLTDDQTNPMRTLQGSDNGKESNDGTSSTIKWWWRRWRRRS
jgi:hypothetical protein